MESDEFLWILLGVGVVVVVTALAATRRRDAAKGVPGKAPGQRSSPTKGTAAKETTKTSAKGGKATSKRAPKRGGKKKRKNGLSPAAPAPAPVVEKAPAAEKALAGEKTPAGDAAESGLVRLRLHESTPSLPKLPKLEYEDDLDVDPTLVADIKAVANGEAPRLPEQHQPPVLPRLLDADAVDDEPTQANPLIVTCASAQTDAGLRRKRNEDSLLVADPHGLYVVADGMGGYSGGEVASQLAVQVISDAFEANEFAAAPHERIPRRASELARAIQMANAAIYAKSRVESKLDGMGTTVVAARFSVNKQRLYVAHAGDSRMYRLRDGELEQITQDHTMSTLGVAGPQGAHLSRAVGIWPIVPVDIGLLKPVPDDLYLLCSDGLTKMVAHSHILEILEQERDLHVAVDRLIEAANTNGGKDNITVILVRIDAPAPIAAAS
jgi:serine/threonine protein phosphatase PrpC